MRKTKSSCVLAALMAGATPFLSIGISADADRPGGTPARSDRSDHVFRIAYATAPTAAPQKRTEFFADCAAAGINTVLIDTRIINTKLTTMKRDPSGEVNIVAWHGSNLVKRPLVGREAYVALANAAAAEGLDVLFTHQLKWNEWDVLTNVLGPGYARSFNGPTRYGSSGEIPVPAPLARGFWLDINLCAAGFYAEISKECPNVRGFMWDFETYGCPTAAGAKGTACPRNNASFDDLTFAAVTDEMKRRGQLPTEYACANKAARYDDLRARGKLEKYLSVQSELITAQIAKPFRRAIDQINPDFLLGFYPYECNLYYDAWARGWSTERAPVLVLSESEYYGMRAPMTLRAVEHLRSLGVHFRYLPGSMAHGGSLTPDALARNIRRAKHYTGDYWIFGADTFTTQKEKPNPEGKGWWLTDPGREFWAALGKANAAEGPLPAEDMHLSDHATPPGSLLLTGNRHYNAPAADLDVTVKYDPAPNVPFADDPDGGRLFDGGEYHDPWIAGWEVRGAGQVCQAVVDLGSVCTLAKIYIKTGHLAMFPVPDGRLTVSVSGDGEEYAVLDQQATSRGKFRGRAVWDDLGLRGRFIKVSFLATKVQGREGIGISEVAAWGRPD